MPKSKPVRAAIYCRVSTHDQQTLPMQLEAAREFCARSGWTVVAEVTEEASGAKVRPKRNELLADARRRKVDAIVVWKLDRWGRSTADLTTTLEELRAVGCTFASVTEALDVSTPSGRALVGMLAVVAEFERDLIRERVKAGMQAARKRGQHLGRRPLACKASARILELAAEGTHSQRAIARAVGVDPATVRKVLRAEAQRTE